MSDKAKKQELNDEMLEEVTGGVQATKNLIAKDGLAVRKKGENVIASSLDYRHAAGQKPITTDMSTKKSGAGDGGIPVLKC
ncbi:MAG: hypothetical protein K6G16_09515 [Lachnospiraceae bacterium]|nr:hypothetical protein [Lachnospiraceae bacterium]